MTQRIDGRRAAIEAGRQCSRAPNRRGGDVSWQFLAAAECLTHSLSQLPAGWCCQSGWQTVPLATCSLPGARALESLRCAPASSFPAEDAASRPVPLFVRFARLRRHPWRRRRRLPPRPLVGAGRLPVLGSACGRARRRPRSGSRPGKLDAQSLRAAHFSRRPLQQRDIQPALVRRLVVLHPERPDFFVHWWRRPERGNARRLRCGAGRGPLCRDSHPRAPLVCVTLLQPRARRPAVSAYPSAARFASLARAKQMAPPCPAPCPTRPF